MPKKSRLSIMNYVYTLSLFPLMSIGSGSVVVRIQRVLTNLCVVCYQKAINRDPASIITAFLVNFSLGCVIVRHAARVCREI